MTQSIKPDNVQSNGSLVWNLGRNNYLFFHHQVGWWLGLFLESGEGTTLSVDIANPHVTSGEAGKILRALRTSRNRAARREDHQTVRRQERLFYLSL